MKIIYILVIIALLLSLLNCEDSSHCAEETEITVNIDFKKLNSINTDTIINNLTIIGLDTPYLNNNNIKSVNLSLLQISDTCEFTFAVNTVVETISFYSKRELYLISYDCGFGTRFTLDSVITGKKIINAVSIIKPEVDITDETNIIFYF